MRMRFIPVPPPLPAPLAALDPPGRAFVALFNHWARGQSLTGTLAPLEGKRLCIRVTDLPLRLHVRIVGGTLKVAAPGLQPHVTLRGRLRDFCKLALRAEDPDTLFFERRLSLEGETETGLAIKNALDALEWDWSRHVRSVLPARAAQALIALCAHLPNPLARHRTPDR